jgi:hypothetical protein
MTAPDLRFRVMAALEAAGFASRGRQLPTQASGGTFTVIGGDSTGCNVTAEWWDAAPDELDGLRGRLARALEEAGYSVVTELRRIYVPPQDEPGGGS